ncbi:helix-turn-helix domain-containing protein [Shewanella sp. YLB-07]|uniref:helix-turn-helix domain-containing protein n=1 Tax=Shewanella sp. YLB-07 TaxID=2601268 RepID=UPI00128D7FCF|nr:helix-turn-helix domain-containing protein [Shewanella sp. YLB-07]MPY24426.1 hypothetical protein [Shewanella sp. YLB-07]
MIDQFYINSNNEKVNVYTFIKKPLATKGGKVLVDRLLHVFNLRNKIELSEIIGVSTGSIATWQTRSTVPYELLIRIHLATGISIAYLLFDKAEVDLNVMQYCQDPNKTANFASINQNIHSFHYPLHQLLHCDGGVPIINRLLKVLGVESKAELARLCSVNIGTLATWQTRKTTPHELLCRVHLATGVSMHDLCFGYEWEDRKAQENDVEPVDNTCSSQDSLTDGVTGCDNTYVLDNGKLTTTTHYVANNFFWSNIGISPASDIVIISDNKSYFIDKKALTVTKGLYLFLVNGVFQLGELRQLPDGNVYFIDGDDKYEVNPETTEVHGKVVSVLARY